MQNGSAAIPPIDIGFVNARVDGALRDNRRAEIVVFCMAGGIFLTGIAVLIVGYWQMNPYLTTGAAVAQLLLYWPVREVLKLRRDNLVLQTLPTIIRGLPPADACVELRKTLSVIRGDK
jgi:hypothetical protein